MSWVWLITYQESTSNHDQNAMAVGGLSVESCDLVRNLLERKAL